MVNNHYEFMPTLLEKLPALDLEVELYVKRDDLFSKLGGGSKARKLQYIFYKGQQMGSNAVVTAGGCQSNHVRATALCAAYMGWRAIMIIHDEEPQKPFWGNLRLTQLAGAEIRFVKKDDVARAMDQAMDDLKSSGYNPFYIWGGGHCVEGSLAYYCAVKELKEQLGDRAVDYIVVASGTGTTQAGLEVGCRSFMPRCKVLGVSIARDRGRGSAAVLDSMQALNNHLGSPIKMPKEIAFDDRWNGGGYEQVYPELRETIILALQRYSLVLDPTYTGKAFYALIHYIAEGIIPKGSSVVFWHTGGLLNLMSAKGI